MHVACPVVDCREGHGIFVGEDLALLEAEVNRALAAYEDAGFTLWDADITGVGGGRLFMVSLTVQDANMVPDAANPDQVRAQLYGGETPAAVLAERAARYADGDVGENLYLDKLGATSNGRWFANLQITGTFTPPLPPG